MLITREIDYALRILRHLQHGMASAAEIEKTQQVSADFSRKILRKLKKAGIVEAVRGSRGGYILSVPCDNLTLWDVKVALEPESMVNRCTCDDYVCENRDKSSCGVHRESCRIEALLKKEMKSSSLTEIFGL